MLLIEPTLQQQIDGELLGDDPLPVLGEVAIEARRDLLQIDAIEAALTAVEHLTSPRSVEAANRWIDSMLALSAGWRRYEYARPLR